MADPNAPRDGNWIPSLLGTSNADGQTAIPIYDDPVTHRLLVSTSGSGLQYQIYVTVGPTNADFIVSNYIDVGDAINAAYASLPTNGGVVFVQDATYSFSTPIVFGTNGKFATLMGNGGASTRLIWTPTSGTAITFNDGNPTGHLNHQVTGFTLMGSASLIAAGQTNTNTSVGIFYGGSNGAVGVNTHDMNVNGFGTNWQIGSNAYMLAFNNCANSGGNGGQASQGALVHMNTSSNSGERNVFQGCTFTDPGNSNANNAIYITSTGTASNFFSNCSFDDVQVFVGTNNGTTTFIGNHWENSDYSAYGAYVPILGVSSDKATQIVFIGNEIANDANGAGTSFVTIIHHGGQLVAMGNHINNYGGQTITNFIDHGLDNGVSSDVLFMNQVQSGGLTNLVAGSGGVAYTQAAGSAFLSNVGNSYTAGLMPQSSNTNAFISGSNTAGSYDHNGNWGLGVNTASIITMSGKTITAGHATAYVAKTATYSAVATDEVIDCTSGTFTVTLPTAVGVTGQTYIVKNSGAGTITIATTSAQTIDGNSTISLSTQYASTTVVSDGANWKIIG